MTENFSYKVQKWDTISGILKEQNIKPINYNKLPRIIHIWDTIKIWEDWNLYLNKQKLYQITKWTKQNIHKIKEDIINKKNPNKNNLDQINDLENQHILSIINDLENPKIPKRVNNNPKIVNKIKNKYNTLLNIIKNPNNPDYNNILYWEIDTKYAKNIPGTFIAKWLLDRKDWKIDLEVNKKWNPNSILLKQRDWTYILAYYWKNWYLKVATYASPWKNNWKHETKIKENHLIPRYASWLKDKYHLSYSPWKDFNNAIMLYAISEEWAQSIHFWETNWKPRSHWCIRIPMFYAKALFETIWNKDKVAINAENLYEEELKDSKPLDETQAENNIKVVESFPA